MNRVTDPADPRRCRYTFPHEQCWNESAHGSDHCEAHGGQSTAGREDKRLYLINNAKYRTRMAQLTEHEQVKSLKEEIALARMLVEERLSCIKNENDLVTSCGPINTMLLTVERLVKSAHSIEQNLGALLAKPTVLKLGQLMCQIVIEELEGIDNYEAVVDRITERMVHTISVSNNEQAA